LTPWRAARTSAVASRGVHQGEPSPAASVGTKRWPNAARPPASPRTTRAQWPRAAFRHSQHAAPDCSRAVEPPFILRSVMNRFTQKVLSGGIAAGLSVAFAVSANAQAARTGAWTLDGKEGGWK